jgi:hypothetical protein
MTTPGPEPTLIEPDSPPGDPVDPCPGAADDNRAGEARIDKELADTFRPATHRPDGLALLTDVVSASRAMSSRRPGSWARAARV